MAQVGKEPRLETLPPSEAAQPVARSRSAILLGQLAGGVTLGLFWAMLAVPLTQVLGRAGDAGWDVFGGALLGIIIGYPLGVLFGVWAVGKLLGARGVMWRAAVLSLGTLALILLLGANSALLGKWIMVLAIVALSPVMALVGYHLTGNRPPSDEGGDSATPHGSP